MECPRRVFENESFQLKYLLWFTFRIDNGDMCKLKDLK